MQLPGSARKNYHVPWETGRESESMSSENAGIASAVLAPGGVFINKIERWSMLTASTFPLPTPVRMC